MPCNVQSGDHLHSCGHYQHYMTLLVLMVCLCTSRLVSNVSDRIEAADRSGPNWSDYDQSKEFCYTQAPRTHIHSPLTACVASIASWTTLNALLHRCPAVLQHLAHWLQLDRSSISALLATNRGVRYQISAVLSSHFTMGLLPVVALHVAIDPGQLVASQRHWPFVGFQKLPKHRPGNVQSWSALQTLHMCYSKISIAAATYLVNSSLPQLHQLDLSFSPLSTQTAAKMSEASWPQLQDLTLRHSICNADVLQHIAMGSWPALTILDISRYQQDESRYFQSRTPR